MVCIDEDDPKFKEWSAELQREVVKETPPIPPRTDTPRHNPPTLLVNEALVEGYYYLVVLEVLFKV